MIRCKVRGFSWLLLALSVSLATGANAQDGVLDPTFGNITSGRTVVAFDRDSVRTDRAVGAVELADASVLIVGSATIGRTVSTPTGDLPLVGVAMVKLKADGKPDPGFGPSGNGKLVIDDAGVGDFSIVQKVLARRNAQSEITSILVLATKHVPSFTAPGNSDVVVFQLHADGTRDFGFNNGLPRLIGFDLPQSNKTDLAGDFVLQPDGKLIVLGTASNSTDLTDTDFVLVRLNTNGSDDLSFGSDGTGRTIVAFNPSTTLGPASRDLATSLLLLPDGRMLVGGTSAIPAAPTRSVSYELARLLPNAAALDPSFAAPGNSPFGLCTPGVHFMKQIAADATGEIVVLGTALHSSDFPLFPCITGFTMLSDGNASTRPYFDPDSLRPAIISGDLSASAMQLMPNGTTLIAYTGCNGDDCDFLLQQQPVNLPFGNLSDRAMLRVPFDRAGDFSDVLNTMIPVSGNKVLLIGNARGSSQATDSDFAVARVILHEVAPFANGFE